jgi:hypothetical protein
MAFAAALPRCKRLVTWSFVYLVTMFFLCSLGNASSAPIASRPRARCVIWRLRYILWEYNVLAADMLLLVSIFFVGNFVSVGM